MESVVPWGTGGSIQHSFPVSARVGECWNQRTTGNRMMGVEFLDLMFASSDNGWLAGEY
jgi:hypothetical protein